MGREQSFVGSQSLPLTLHLDLHPLQNIESNAVGDLRRGVLRKLLILATVSFPMLSSCFLLASLYTHFYYSS